MGFQTSQREVGQQPKEEKNTRKEKRVDQVHTKSMVVIPYVRGVSEALQRAFRNGVATSMKTQELAAALGACQGQMVSQRLGGSSILHPMQKLLEGVHT